MRPSISMTLEPGLERGVLGRDLYTFVTSASGHMMRTLQKPRKNRPSKRQVNHRRFLHNMIQRKFADIEAANQREASTLHSKEEDKNLFSLPSQKTETLVQPGNPFQGHDPQDPDKCSVHTDEKGASTSQRDVSVGSSRPAMSGKKQPDSGHLWKRHPQCATLTSKKNNQSRGRQRRERRKHKSVGSPKGVNYYQEAEPFHTECNNDKLQLTKDSQTHQDSGFIEVGQKLDTSPSFSLELSPLSLASCDLSIQMFTDVSSTCAQAQRNIADISESPWTDIMDLFGVGSKDLGGCMDVEAYLESICACQGDVVQEVSAGGVRFTDHPESFCSDRCEVADLQHETGEYMYEYGYSCHGDQTINQLLAAETHTFNSFKSTDMIQNQVPESISHIYNTLEQHTYRHPREVSHCMLVNCENGQNFTPFEGIAQSFSVPLHDAEHRPISTPPQEEEWLFTDILKDRKSPNC